MSRHNDVWNKSYKSMEVRYPGGSANAYSAISIEESNKIARVFVKFELEARTGETSTSLGIYVTPAKLREIAALLHATADRAESLESDCRELEAEMQKEA